MRQCQGYGLLRAQLRDEEQNCMLAANVIFLLVVGDKRLLISWFQYETDLTVARTQSVMDETKKPPTS
jgi:hypothetical protein